jgi:hypothetical protein
MNSTAISAYLLAGKIPTSVFPVGPGWQWLPPNGRFKQRINISSRTYEPGGRKNVSVLHKAPAFLTAPPPPPRHGLPWLVIRIGGDRFDRLTQRHRILRVGFTFDQTGQQVGSCLTSLPVARKESIPDGGKLIMPGGFQGEHSERLFAR